MFGTVFVMTMQASFVDAGTPLALVTFCVVDLETTGGSPADDGITEVAAVKVRGGEVSGTFQTLVDPGVRMPACVRLLTGISEPMLRDAPPIEAVLPSLLEFAGSSILVAHNASFDVGFLDAALTRNAYPRLSNKVIDTARLARKILADEVRNYRLATLAEHLRCAHRPAHRALADVLATTDVLHALIERVAGFGITTLEEFEAASRTRLDGIFRKIELARAVPRASGIYRFVGATGQTLYVGKATDLRSRVRSYFYGDTRPRMRGLLAETQEIRIERHVTMLEAEVAEARAIATEMPPYNRAGKRRGTWYLKVWMRARVPRIATSRCPRDDGALYLGPLPSRRAAEVVLLALRDGLDLHRCVDPARCRACPYVRFQTCPGDDVPRHRATVRRAVNALLGDPRPLLDTLEIRMRRLAAQGRFEEAAEARDRAAALERMAARMAEVQGLVDAGEVVLLIHDRRVIIRSGRLADAGDAARVSEFPPLERLGAGGANQPLSPEVHFEAATVARWIVRHATEVRVISVSGTWSQPAWARPPGRFGSGGGDAGGRRRRA